MGRFPKLVFFTIYFTFCAQFLFGNSTSSIKIEYNYIPGINNLQILTLQELNATLLQLDAVESAEFHNNTVYIKLKPLLKSYVLKNFSIFSKYKLKKILGLRTYYRYSIKKLLLSGNLASFYLKTLGFLDVSIQTQLFIDKNGFAKLIIKGKEGNFYVWNGIDFKNSCFKPEIFYKTFGKPLGSPFNKFLLYQALNTAQNLCKEKGYFFSFPFYKEPYKVYRKPISVFLEKNFLIYPPLGFKFLTTYFGILVENPFAGLKFLLHPTYAVYPEMVFFKVKRLSIELKGNKELSSSFLLKEIYKYLPIFGKEIKPKLIKKTIELIYKNFGFFDVKVYFKRTKNGKFQFFINEGKRYKVKIFLKPRLIANFKISCKNYSPGCIDKLTKIIKNKLKNEAIYFRSLSISKTIDRKNKVILFHITVKNPQKIYIKPVFILKIRNKPLREKLKTKLKAIDWKICWFKKNCLEYLETKLLSYLNRYGCLRAKVKFKKIRNKQKAKILIIATCKHLKKFGKTAYWIEGKIPKREIEYITLNFEGKKYNPKLLEVLRNRFDRSRLFESYTVKTVDVSNKTLVLIEGTQRKLISLEGSFGYSSDEGFQLKTSINFYDLLRMGETISTSFEISQKRNLYSVSYYDPYFFSKYWYIGSSIFKKYENHREFDLTQKGLSFTVGRYVGYFSDISLSLLGSKYWLENSLTKPEGKLLKLSLAFQTVYPIYVGTEKRGLFTSFINFSTSTGNNNFQKITATVNYSQLILTKLFFHLKTSAGWVSHNAPIFEKFYLGGIKNLKGYSYESVAPKGGGDIYWYSTLEGGLKVSSNGLYIFGGTDVGNCVKRNQNPFKGLKKDIFLGVGTITSLGPLRFVVAAPLEGKITFSNLRYLFLLGFNF